VAVAGVACGGAAGVVALCADAAPRINKDADIANVNAAALRMLNLPNKWNQVRLRDSPQEMMLFGAQVNQGRATKTPLSDNNLN